MHTPLEIIELSKVYNKKEAVKNISFKINKNEIIGILGSKWLWKNYDYWNDLGIVKANKRKGVNKWF